jgi:hypothetical protein
VKEIKTIEFKGGLILSCPYIDLVDRPNEEELAKLKESIQEFGILEPIIVTDHLEIINGHTRAEIAQELGFGGDQVPHVVAPWEAQKRQDAAVVLNSDCKREFNRERRLTTVKKLRELGWGYKRIARACSVTTSVIEYDLESLGLKEPPPSRRDEPSTPEAGGLISDPPTDAAVDNPTTDVVVTDDPASGPVVPDFTDTKGGSKPADKPVAGGDEKKPLSQDEVGKLKTDARSHLAGLVKVLSQLGIYSQAFKAGFYEVGKAINGR